MLLGLPNWTLTEAGAATYYVSNEGSDDNDGKSPEAAWKTLARVSAADLQPGDAVLLRRGDQWREPLRPRSGSEEGHITYGAYGEGPKPLLLGSVTRSRPEDWRDEGGNIWSTVPPEEPAQKALEALTPAESTVAWGLHQEGGAEVEGARVAAGGDGEPSSYRVDCASPGKGGSHIQLVTAGLHIEEGKTYRVVFRAKSTEPFKLRMPTLMKSNAPWTGYSSGPPGRRKVIETEWQACAQHYTATVTDDNARLTFYVGGALPAGASFHLDSLSFAECDPDEVPLPQPDALAVDVGNIIFDDEASCGVKVWNEADLDAQGKYWYDEDRELLKLYSAGNPATRYSSIECALRRHMINQSSASYVIYEHLALKYGGAHGIGGGSTHHIIVRDCDFGYIGGGDQHGGERTVRFGNGVEFWGDAHDNLVERCRLWEVYDAALTNQAGGPNTKQYNLHYRNNVIWNCEYSFEYWNRPEKSETYNVYFENNTCVNAGHGWGHDQRPDPSGRQLCFYTSPARAHDITIRNNIFFEAKTNAFYAPGWPAEAIAALVMDNNCWYQQAGEMIKLKEKSYTMAQFGAYQAEQAKEPNSMTAVPGFVDAAKGDYHLTAGSPCVDAGTDVGIETDFESNAAPQGPRPDIGAYELVRE